eukprot:9495770-Pyramimonas_sp.AAC.1
MTRFIVSGAAYVHYYAPANLKDARVEHLHRLNAIIGRAHRNRHLAGLHFLELEPSFRKASVADASHGGALASYPQEGSAVLLMEDRMDRIKYDKKDKADYNDELFFGGPCHKMVIQSCKATRIRH